MHRRGRTALGVGGWGFPRLAPSRRREGKAITIYLSLSCALSVGDGLVGILSVILEPFIFHYLCFG